MHSQNKTLILIHENLGTFKDLQERIYELFLCMQNEICIPQYETFKVVKYSSIKTIQLNKLTFNSVTVHAHILYAV